MLRKPQILACSGLIYPPADYPQGWAGTQAWQAMQLSGVRSPKFCLIATATGDSKEYIGNVLPIVSERGAGTASHLAVWRAHRLDEILRECWEAGIVLAGQSAGSLCWHTGGVTDSFGDSLDPVTNGLAFLPFSNGVHDDLPDQPRRTTYRSFVASGTLAGGYATEDGAALHYVGTELREALGAGHGRRAWKVSPDGDGGFAEEPIEARLWAPPL